MSSSAGAHFAIALCVSALCKNKCALTEEHIRLVSSFTLLNAVMNIFVYIIKDKKFRQDAKKAIMCHVNQVAPQNKAVAMEVPAMISAIAVTSSPALISVPTVTLAPTVASFPL